MFVRSPKELALHMTNQRKRLKLSQKSIGTLVGLKQQTISEFENRPEGTKIDTLFRILSALQLDIELFAKDKIPGKDMWKEEW